MLIDRPFYVQRIMHHANTPLIKVITGVRRCGKSSLLQLVAKEIEKTGVDGQNIITLRMDEFGAPLHPTSDWLVHRIEESLKQANPDKIAYIFLDEIQDVPDWERVVRQLQTRDRTDVYLTGSNAYLLSTELSTLLAGRTVEIAVNPLSFGEYLGFKHQHGIGIGSVDESFREYLRFGGMPGQFDLSKRTPETMTAFLEGIFSSVLIKDVVSRSNIADISLLEKLVSYLFRTSGNLFSTKKIVDTLCSAGRKTSQHTIESYLHALKNALILREVPQCGIKGKEVLNPKRKFYAVDVGLRNYAAGFPAEDIGFQLENVVCNELAKRGCNVTVGKLRDNREVDFIARSNDGKCYYYQVTQSLLNDQVYERELAPLRLTGDNFPKTVLTLDGYRTGTTADGIEIVGLCDWLLETLAEDTE